MLGNPLGSAAKEHAFVTCISVGRDNDEICLELSRNRANLLVRCAGAQLECRDIAIGPILAGKSLESFHESFVPLCLRQQRERQQGGWRLPTRIRDMQ